MLLSVAHVYLCTYLGLATHPNISWPMYLYISSLKLLHLIFGACAVYYTPGFLNAYHCEPRTFRLVHYLDYPAALGTGAPPSGGKLL
jgi:hypothetical protein